MEKKIVFSEKQLLEKLAIELIRLFKKAEQGAYISFAEVLLAVQILIESGAGAKKLLIPVLADGKGEAPSFWSLGHLAIKTQELLQKTKDGLYPSIEEILEAVKTVEKGRTKG